MSLGDGLLTLGSIWADRKIRPAFSRAFSRAWTDEGRPMMKGTRVEGKTTYSMTFPLITTSSGVKIWKTHKGAVWLDPELTSPYDYYQFWINQEDGDTGRFLAFFTFLPMDEVRKLAGLAGSDIRQAKEVLAFEATRLCHGEEAAEKARAAARQLFGGDRAEKSESVPGFQIGMADFGDGIPAYILFEMTGLCRTRSDARRLISQGGGYINDATVGSFDQIIGPGHAVNGSILLRAGKKRYVRVAIE